MTYFDYGQGQPAPASPSRQRRPIARVVVALVVMGIVAAGTALAMNNRQYLSDVWTVWNFEPNAELESYIDRSTMTDHGSFLFEASTPEIAAADRFNGICGMLEAGTGVLGCYSSTDKEITLFDITDDRLDGMEEVVASHEMLHAAWDRMGAEEHTRLAALLEAEADRLAGDQEFVERMELYARTEPGERSNELHSIIGSEVSGISPELEEYYSQYFSDRAALVALHLQSIEVFRQLEATTAALVAEMDALQEGMKADLATYNAGYDQLNADIDDFNTRADNGDFESQEQFDRERAALLARQAQLDALFASIKAREATWNEKHAQLEELNAQAAALNTSINIVPRTAEE